MHSFTSETQLLQIVRIRYVLTFKNHTHKWSANATAHNNAPSVLHKCMQLIDNNSIFDMNKKQ